MPEGYTHIRIAQRAAAAVRYKIKCPAAFAAGANGPDILFCYQAWKPARKRLYDLPALGRRLHGEKTGPFLCSLVRHVRTVPQIEYAMGFLSHYAADTVIHPYVEALCRPGMPYAKKGGHGYFEAALDTLLHEQDTGSEPVPAADCAPALTGEALADIANLLHTCLQEVYELDVPVEYLADSFYHATKLRGLFTSRFGVRKAFYWLIEPLFAGRGYITGHVTPRKMKTVPPDAWTDPFTGEARSGDIFALLAQAQSRSEKYMAATILAWGGQLSSQALAEQLGSMCYLEGRSTALSDPDYVPPAEPEEAAAPVPAEQEKAESPEDATAPEAAAAPDETEADTAPQESAGEENAPQAADAAAQDEGAAAESPAADGEEPAEAAAPAPEPEPAGESAEGPVPPEAPEPAAEATPAGESTDPAEAEAEADAEEDPEPPPVTVLELPPDLPGPAPLLPTEPVPEEVPPTAHETTQQEGETV